jgi:hypothetical protein
MVKAANDKCIDAATQQHAVDSGAPGGGSGAHLD